MYVDALSTLPGWRAQRMYLARSPEPFRAASVLPTNALRAHLKARDSHLVHVHGEVAAAFLLPGLGRMPSVVTLHGANLLRRVRGSRHRLATLNLRAMAARAGRVVCTSHAELDEVASVIARAAMSRFVVIHNGVAVPEERGLDERAAIRAELGVPADTPIALYAGGLEDVKDPLVAVRAAVDACRRGAKLVLLVAGDGPLRASVQADGGEHVRVLGFRKDVARLNSIADIFVLPSRREGLSYALLEAMACGAAPIVSDVPGNVEAVGESAIVAPVGDVAAFAGALTALAQDSATRERLGAQARVRVQREFREDVMLERTRAVYEAVSEERGHG